MRPEQFELDPSNYPFSVEIGTRFGDLDVQNHINNVRVNQLLEEGRMRFGLYMRSTGEKADDRMERRAARLVTVATQVNYLAEVSYPAPVTICSGVISIGTSSYAIASLMLQDGKPVAHCRATYVRSDEGKPAPLPDYIITEVSANLVRHNL